MAALCAEDWERSPAQIGGASGPAAALALAALAQSLARPLFVVFPGPQLYDAALRDLAAFAPELCVVALPTEELHHAEPHETLAAWLPSLRDLLALPESGPALALAPLNSLLVGLPPRETLMRSTLALERGASLAPDALARALDAAGYEPAPQVEHPGQFSRRGGVFDLWPHAEEYPLRLDFFGDELDAIKTFDAATQRSLATHERLAFPILERDELFNAESEGSVLDYLSQHTPTIQVERREILTRLEGGRPFHIRGSRKRRFEAVRRWTDALPRVELSHEPAMARQGAINLDTRHFPPRGGGAAQAAEAVSEILPFYDHVEIHAGSEGEAARLREALDAHGVRGGMLRFFPHEISGSVLLPGARVALLSGADLLGKQRLRAGLLPDEASLAVTSHRAIDDFVRLDPGDYVVHVEHGIARYRGTEELRTPDGARGEYLRLEFEGGTEIHVPVTGADAVQKYIGSRGAAPRLSKYRSRAWSERKGRVKEAVARLAADMLRFQALRRTETGYACPLGDPTLHDFVESFPYRDTPDQEKAWADIERDMEAARPMDRLLCGDVGFGKTELAMRAAFKAVMAGRQAAVLAPTTVLVQQHELSFRSRMAGFPVLIESLSRFKTPGEQQETIRRLVEGKVDIVIGTHRLLSKDVEFKDLGLIVIDEEQRFGVEHKEGVKRLRATVDVLTLSATPIPRTLHMALLGIRDISSLTTPPEHRHPVSTLLRNWDDGLIREAVMNELGRDGQVFFVHNRVFDIEEIVRRLQGIVPEARIVFGHGQMPERELERAMLSFINREADVLVSTTIIESGIDVQSANTMFIDQAHRYGLADLHQLRGRVGRFKHHAYCYLLVSDARVKENAEKRLRAILEHSRLGSGFHIAMRDLEIRGAGNIIGVEQSGHIATVGYDLYCRLLEQAVRELRGEEVAPEVETAVTLDLDLVLPREYIADAAQRVQAYRMLARCDTPARSEAVRASLLDRFGPPPPVVDHLTRLAVTRHRFGRLGVTSVTVGYGLKDAPGYFRFKAINAAAAHARVSSAQPNIRVVDDHTLSLPMGRGLEQPEQRLIYLYNLSQLLVERGILAEPLRPEDEEVSTTGAPEKAAAKAKQHARAPVSNESEADASASGREGAAKPKLRVRVKPRRKAQT